MQDASGQQQSGPCVGTDRQCVLDGAGRRYEVARRACEGPPAVGRQTITGPLTCVTRCLLSVIRDP
jgi:hypothetical protein